MPVKANTLRLVTLKEVMLHQANINKEPPTFQPKVESELKLFIKPVTFQFKNQAFNHNPLFQAPNTSLDQLTPTHTQPAKHSLLGKHTLLEDKLSLLEEAAWEVRMYTDNHKLVVTSLVEVESDNDSFVNFLLYLFVMVDINQLLLLFFDNVKKN